MNVFEGKELNFAGKMTLITTTFVIFMLINNLNLNFIPNAKLIKKSNRSHTEVSIDANLLQQFNDELNLNCDPSNLKTSKICSIFLTKFETDHLLNDYTSKNDCNQCMFDKHKQRIIINYHTFWKLGSNYNDYQLRVLKLNLMSYLATQNLCCSRFMFWKLKDFPKQIETDLLQTFSYYFDKKIIQFKQFESKLICKKTVMFKDHEFCKNSNKEKDFNRHYSVSLSDFVRFVVLDQYGGIYTDGDVIYLKDMNLLWYFGNFAYRWSFTNTINTAVLGINRHVNSSIDELYKEILIKSTDTLTLMNAFHPNLVSDVITANNLNSIYNYAPIKVLHSYLFDSAWLCYDGLEGKLNEKSVCSFNDLTAKTFMNESDFNIKDFFPGAFAYHIHLKNAETQISSTSYFVYIENYFKSVIKLRNKTIHK